MPPRSRGNLTRDSIEAHLTIVFAALAISRTIEIQAGEQTITAADPLPDDVQQILDAIHTQAVGHNVSQLGFHNGRTEGVNTNTKLIKRQMYGRAGFSLLRHRILLR
ncbi:hypothetical protein GCM10025762_12660 [Haloechinothrix salitolerans]